MEGGYLYVIAVMAAVAFASFASYDEERARQSRFALGIILLASLTAPLVSIVRGLDNIDFNYTGEDYSATVVEKTLEEAFVDGISRGIRERFDIRSEDLSVEALGFDADGLKATTVLVTLSGRAAVKNFGEIESYVNGLGVGKCILEVRLGKSE